MERTTHLQILLQVVKSDWRVLAAFLQLNVGVSWHDEVKVQIFNGTAVKRQAIQSQASTLCSLFGENSPRLVSGGRVLTKITS